VQDIQPGCAICVLLTTRNQGSSLPEPGYNQSADAVAIPSVIVGPQITPEFIPEDWGDCPYFPPLPEDHNLIAKVVLVRA
ncbi:hypothetical protein, partial [Shewanella algae]|uniref:hypothetical protein n=1 Tax=Shewanella algae TaxID=38313 RepID=UPI00313EA845